MHRHGPPNVTSHTRCPACPHHATTRCKEQTRADIPPSGLVATCECARSRTGLTFDPGAHRTRCAAPLTSRAERRQATALMPKTAARTAAQEVQLLTSTETEPSLWHSDAPPLALPSTGARHGAACLGLAGQTSDPLTNDQPRTAFCRAARQPAFSQAAIRPSWPRLSSCASWARPPPPPPLAPRSPGAMLPPPLRAPNLDGRPPRHNHANARSCPAVATLMPTSMAAGRLVLGEEEMLVQVFTGAREDESWHEAVLQDSCRVFWVTLLGIRTPSVDGGVLGLLSKREDAVEDIS